MEEIRSFLLRDSWFRFTDAAFSPQKLKRFLPLSKEKRTLDQPVNLTLPLNINCALAGEKGREFFFSLCVYKTKRESVC